MSRFLQHNLRLVVLGKCLLIVVMKFQDKFARLRQLLNSPNGQDKFQIMMYQHVFDVISSKFCSVSHVFVNFAGLPEFRSPVTTLNIRSPDTMSCVIYIIQTGNHISPVGHQRATWGFF